MKKRNIFTIILVALLAIAVVFFGIFLNRQSSETRSSASGDFSKAEITLSEKIDNNGYISVFLNSNGEILKEALIVIEHSDKVSLAAELSSNNSGFDGTFNSQDIDGFHHKLTFISNQDWSMNTEIAKIYITEFKSDNLLLSIDNDTKVVDSNEKVKSISQKSSAKKYTYSKEEIKVQTKTTSSGNSCIKKCSQYQYRCGQSDGCGGICSSLDDKCTQALCNSGGINLCGKKCETSLCKNENITKECISKCDSYSYKCGQSDGCGGSCSNADDICPTYSCFSGGKNVCGRNCPATKCN